MSRRVTVVIKKFFYNPDEVTAALLEAGFKPVGTEDDTEEITLWKASIMGYMICEVENEAVLGQLQHIKGAELTKQGEICWSDQYVVDITIDPEANLQSAIDALVSAGLHEHEQRQTPDKYRTISGAIGSDRLTALAEVAGVQCIKLLIIISIDPAAAMADFNGIVAKLVKAGLTKRHLLDSIWAVAGEAELSALNGLAQVPGVWHIEFDRLWSC